jgi:predicted PurR-regulated permease PerM
VTPAPTAPRSDAPATPEPTAPATRTSRSVAFHALLLVGGLAALFLLLVEVRPSLGPFWAVAAGAVLLWPVRDTRAGRAVLGAGALVFGAFLLSQLGGVLTPFVLAFVLAYLLDPAVGWARKRWGWPRWLPTALLTLVVVAALVAVGVFLVPAVAAQVESLVRSAGAAAMRLPAWVQQSSWLDGLEEAGIVDRDALVEGLTGYVPQQIGAVTSRIPALLLGLTRQVGVVLGLVTLLALFPVLFFYMLKDFPVLQRGLVSLLPRVDGRREYLQQAGTVFGGYLRGQLTISAASAVLVAVPLVLFGVPFSLLLGLLAGLLNLIPNLGSILTYVIGTLLMLAFGTLGDVAIVLGVLSAQAVVEQAVLTPNIMGQSVGLHPVVIMLSLFVCGALFGFLGLLLAVPATALLASAIRAYRETLVLDFEGSGAQGSEVQG